MSLLQKRWLQKVMDVTTIANQNLQDKTGLTIPIMVNADSFPDDEQVMNDFFVHEIYGLSSIINAMLLITKDALGKDALRDQIKAISIVNTAKKFNDEGSKSVNVEDKVLYIHCAFNHNSNNLYRPEELAKQVERLL